MRHMCYEDITYMNHLDYAERKQKLSEDYDNLASNRADAKIMAETIGEHPYLILLVDHELQVRSSEDNDATGKQMRHAVLETKKVTRRTKVLKLGIRWFPFIMVSYSFHSQTGLFPVIASRYGPGFFLPDIYVQFAMLYIYTCVYEGWVDIANI